MFFDIVLGNIMVDGASMINEGVKEIKLHKGIEKPKKLTQQERTQLTDEERIDYDIRMYNERMLR